MLEINHCECSRIWWRTYNIIVLHILENRTDCIDTNTLARGFGSMSSEVEMCVCVCAYFIFYLKYPSTSLLGFSRVCWTITGEIPHIPPYILILGCRADAVAPLDFWAHNFGTIMDNNYPRVFTEYTDPDSRAGSEFTAAVFESRCRGL